MPRTKAVEKKLGRHGADGLYYPGSDHVLIDLRLADQRGERHRLSILIHEWMHRHELASPEAHARMEEGDTEAANAIEEADCRRLGDDLAALLWTQGYRRVRLR